MQSEVAYKGDKSIALLRCSRKTKPWLVEVMDFRAKELGEKISHQIMAHL